MASPQSTLPNDEKEAQDSAHNPGEQAYQDGIGSAYSGAGLDQLEAFANDPANHGGDNKNGGDSTDAVRDAEDAGGNWQSNYRGGQSAKGRRFTTANFKGFVKKRGAIFAVLAFLGIGGGVVGGFLGPASMLVNLMENMTINNDSSSTSMERRFMKAFGFATTGDPICANSSKSITCKMGRISNVALDQLKTKGITPIYDSSTTNTDSKKGYPSKNPTGYSIETEAGKVNVAAKDLTGYLAKNPKVAAKILGTGGAFNLRLKAWSGKYITKKFLDPFNLKKDGGIADGKNGGVASKDRFSKALEKIRARIPGIDKLNAVPDGIRAKVNDQLGKAKKGGVGYTLAVAGCMGVKAPGYIAAGVAAIQLAQILPYINDVILSPASKLKASGVDTSAGFTSDDMSAIGSLLTNKSPRSSDGKMSSALDSPILLSALGINKGKPPVSAAYTPGYAALTNPVVVGSVAASKAVQPACNVVLNPASMYSAMAVDAAITVASSTTLVGGLIKVAGSVAISEIATQATQAIITDIASKVLASVAANNAIPKAVGQDLGDVLGISGLAFFSAGGMARNLPALKTTQLSGYVALQQQNQAFRKQMDIASLSPFDTSSQYTFLGSIVNNLSVATLATGSYDGSIFSQILGYLKTPFVSLSPSASAANFTPESCGYAADFGLDTTDPSNTPAINAAGMPCTGITTDQASMSTSEALTLIQNEGWLDESITIPDGATIDDLVSSGYIKSGTPLSDFITSCGNASSGDYLFNSAGCTVNSVTKDPNTVSGSLSKNSSCTNGACVGSKNDFGSTTTGQVKDPRSLLAISVFLLDYQTIQSLNGEDVISGNSTATSSSLDKKSLAAKIVAKNRVTYLNNNVKPKLEDIASGKVDGNAMPCGININILKIIDTVTDSYPIKISDLNRMCSNNSTAGGRSSPASRHYAGNGSGLDIAVANGKVLDGRNAASVGVINLEMPILSAAAINGKSSRVGQSACGPAVTLAVGVTTFPDNCDHVHVDVPPASDPNLQYDPSVRP
ncbi:MAG: hypothetical protein EOT05_01220 [Candidatus Microsaccharimonas sossegonensis]|uniref:Uncharacterized protein n=1 Tax=Candidatus Microsaccharimonas sossegonensis TaxID=2506948 RepID=A0A4Q0AHC9_9BACT|nr:MAG: hypothetical protein EOT05_01220 [Candidatus Microsaccharimonas sossegonensis]